jgi:transcriptional antiterminator RfaH
VLSDYSAWYIIRTGQHKERFVRTQASRLVDDFYLPLLRYRGRHFGKFVDKTEPLFPCYLFARLSLAKAYYRLRHSPGVVGLVCAGSDPCELDATIVEEIKSRESNGVIVLNEPALQPQQRVNILGGPLCGFEAVFERYLSGAERVSILLDSVGRGNLRAIVRASIVAPTSISRLPV